MRTTLDIDEDVLGVAKQLASQRRQPLGRIISDLVRESLRPKSGPRVRNGFEIVASVPGAPILTLERVNELRDGDE